ncbi:MAG: DNA polymerase III subunit epsilon [Magnetococcales bacterium]|nr:DNA polymerase III subunit epsilon [Magnetococcales bacterium]
MERVIILDTETTGISPADGHRIVEIGCIELVNYRKGDQHQWYLNPEREIPREATRIHGITNDQVATAPPFREVAQTFLDFIQTDQLVIHNASFDMGFLNMELERCGLPTLPKSQAIDTLAMARKKFPGSPASLDALCRRFKIDNSNRTFHGALLDSELLAEVYIELMGGNQFNLNFDLISSAPDESRRGGSDAVQGNIQGISLSNQPLEPLHFPKRTWSISQEEEASHLAFVELLTKKSGKNLWPSEGG